MLFRSLIPVHFWFFRVWVVYTFSLPVSLPVTLYFFTSCLPYSGDYSTEVPPLPIPNREVKLSHADGTA